MLRLTLINVFVKAQNKSEQQYFFIIAWLFPGPAENGEGCFFLKKAADCAVSCRAGRSDTAQLRKIYVKTKLNGHFVKKKKKLKSACCVMLNDNLFAPQF